MKKKKHGLVLRTQDPIKSAQKLTLFSISLLCHSVQLMRTGPFVDYNLMIAFSDSTVNGGVSYIFSPPRAARFLPKPISGLQILPFFQFHVISFVFQHPQLWDFVRNCEIQFLGCRDFPTPSGWQMWPLAFRSSPLCPRVITNVSKVFLNFCALGARRIIYVLYDARPSFITIFAK